MSFSRVKRTGERFIQHFTVLQCFYNRFGVKGVGFVFTSYDDCGYFGCRHFFLLLVIWLLVSSPLLTAIPMMTSVILDGNRVCSGRLLNFGYPSLLLVIRLLVSSSLLGLLLLPMMTAVILDGDSLCSGRLSNFVYPSLLWFVGDPTFGFQSTTYRYSYDDFGYFGWQSCLFW